jgi:hypothetical protein
VRLTEAGPDREFGLLLTEVLQEWRFAPLRDFGIQGCFRTSFLVYLRIRDGKPTVIVPGLLNSGQVR